MLGALEPVQLSPTVQRDLTDVVGRYREDPCHDAGREPSGP
jgi:hypothetical protein